MQRAWALLYCQLWPVWLYHIFPHYLINEMVIGKKVTEHKIRFFIYSTSFVRNISHSKKISARYYHKFSREVPVFRIKWKFNILDRFWKIRKYQISWKSVQWEPSCFMWTGRHTARQSQGQTDRQTDTTKLIVALFRDFAKAPKPEILQ